MQYRTRNKGLTLIELLITVAILGIITAVAWPFFTAQKYKHNRHEAIAALLLEAQRQERLLNDNGAYANFAAYATDRTRVDGGRGLYTISIVVPNACPPAMGEVCFTLTATPLGSQANDTGCTTFTLDHLGRRGSTGTSNNCWSQ